MFVWVGLLKTTFFHILFTFKFLSRKKAGLRVIGLFYHIRNKWEDTQLCWNFLKFILYRLGCVQAHIVKALLGVSRDNFLYSRKIFE